MKECGRESSAGKMKTYTVVIEQCPDTGLYIALISPGKVELEREKPESLSGF